MSPENTPTQKEHWFSENLKKYVPTMIFLALSSFIISYWSSRDALSELARQVQINKEASITNAANIAKNAENYSQLIIAFTKISEAQIRMAKDIQEMQERERRNLEAQAGRK